MKAVIMAGGQGTRIREIASDIPKSLIPIAGKPIIEYQIENMKKSGITEIIIVIGRLGDMIRERLGDGTRFGVQISYFNEDRPLGTAGALYYLKEKLTEDFLMTMGDLMFSVDFRKFMDFHKKEGGEATLFVHPNSHPYDSDIIVTDTVRELSEFTADKCLEGMETEPLIEKSLVTGVISKHDERIDYCHNMVNSGIYAFSKSVLETVPEPTEKIDIDKDIIRKLIAQKKVRAYHSTEYVKDMGTPDRFYEVTDAVRAGLPEKKNLSNKQKCIFLDRDGTINVFKGLINNPEDIELLENAAEAIKRINASEYLAVVITNQPVVARGDCSFETMDRLIKKLETLLGEKGAYIDDFCFCPHHPDSGYDGEVKELKFRCNCRKPKTGLIDRAAQMYNIDIKSSYMIGDMTMDIACGENAGTKTVLLKTGCAGEDGLFEIHPDLICRDLKEAVDIILNENTD